tara:strand:- start:29 stop:334 length:306 start_codon:yes stop_codon:yes gene_type:complete
MNWNDYYIPLVGKSCFNDPPTEEQFKEHVFDLMDQVAKYELYWILGDAFRNANLSSFQNSGDDWNGKGYWEFVHDSIVNGINMRYSHIKQCECYLDIALDR